MKGEPLTGRGAAGVLLSAFLAGGLIALGGTVFLSLENRVLGASFFSIGLFFIVSMQLWLYTGKIGYLCRNRGSYAVQLGCTLAGNFAGTGCVALLLRQTRCAPALIERASALCLTKLSDTLPSLFLLAVCCGALMYLGGNGYGTFAHPLGKYGAVFLAVTVFILSGFEHCVANMFYYSLAGVWGAARAWSTMSVTILGNSVGSILMAEGYRLSHRLLTEPQ